MNFADRNAARRTRRSRWSGTKMVVGAVAAVMVATLLPVAIAQAAVTASDPVENITAIGDDDSASVMISDDGNLVAFTSLAGNLTADAPNGNRNLFLHNRTTDQTINITAGADQNTSHAAISGDGSTVVFSTYASNITADTDTGNDGDIFSYDVASGTTTRITPDNVPGSSGDAIETNNDGSTVVFTSSANLAGTASGYVKAFMWTAGDFTKLSEGVNHNAYGVAIAGDGSLITMNAFFFGEMQWYIWDQVAMAPIYQSPGSLMKISDDGSYAAMRIITPQGYRVALRDNTGGVPTWTTLVSTNVEAHAISADGSQIAMVTSNQAGDVRTWLYEVPSLTRTMILNPAEPAGGVDINVDGSAVAFASEAAGLTTDPDNGHRDIFVMYEAALAATCDGEVVTVNMNLGQTPTPNSDVILGTPGNDTILAGDGDDIVCAGTGNDTVFGGNGLDKIYGEAGNDRLGGNAGDDEIFGGDDDDDLYGGQGNDKMSGDHGDDTLYGSTGNDEMNGGVGEDRLYGSLGSDQLNGGLGNDALYGDAHADTLDGGDGDDVMVGGPHNDIMMGSGGADDMQGGGGNDTMSGGDGDDLVRGGRDDDSLAGDAGTDTCVGQLGVDTADATCEAIASVP